MSFHRLFFIHGQIIHCRHQILHCQHQIDQTGSTNIFMLTDTPQHLSDESPCRQVLLQAEHFVGHSRRARAQNSFIEPPSAFRAIIINYENKAEFNDLPIGDSYYLSLNSSSTLQPNCDIENEQRRRLEWVHRGILLLGEGGEPILHLPL